MTPSEFLRAAWRFDLPPDSLLRERIEVLRQAAAQTTAEMEEAGRAGAAEIAIAGRRRILDAEAACRQALETAMRRPTTPAHLVERERADSALELLTAGHEVAVLLPRLRERLLADPVNHRLVAERTRLAP